MRAIDGRPDRRARHWRRRECRHEAREHRHPGRHSGSDAQARCGVDRQDRGREEGPRKDLQADAREPAVRALRLDQGMARERQIHRADLGPAHQPVRRDALCAEPEVGRDAPAAHDVQGLGWPPGQPAGRDGERAAGGAVHGHDAGRPERHVGADRSRAGAPAEPDARPDGPHHIDAVGVLPDRTGNELQTAAEVGCAPHQGLQGGVGQARLPAHHGTPPRRDRPDQRYHVEAVEHRKDAQRSQGRRARRDVGQDGAAAAEPERPRARQGNGRARRPGPELSARQPGDRRSQVHPPEIALRRRVAGRRIRDDAVRDREDIQDRRQVGIQAIRARRQPV